MSDTTSTATDHKPPFVKRWLFSTNHKDIGTLYLVLSILSGILGTGLSVLLRAELQEPGLQIFADPNLFNVVVSSHGLVMIFFVIMPALIGGFGNWFVPIMIGAPDMAFPRMNNISFWLLAASLVLFILSVFMPGASGSFGHSGGWTLYPP
jgi:cytochrome c oxidase subunit I